MTKVGASDGCCGDEAPERLAVDNPAGLPALRWRIGTHASFLARMVARLTTQSIPDGPSAGTRPLRTLTTRGTADPTLAVLDAFACVGDVLTFYQERIANECFLGTATERRSVLELARAVGYELDPGVAARAYLAFTLDDGPASPPSVELMPELAVMSIPGPDEVPQVFETVESFTAHVAWNQIPAVTALPQALSSGREIVWLQGQGTGLRVGDRLLFVNRGWLPDGEHNATALRRVAAVDALPALGVTRVRLDVALADLVDSADDPIEVYALRKSARLYGSTAQPWALLDTATQGRIIGSGSTGGTLADWPAILSFERTAVEALDLDREYEGLAARNRVVIVAPTLDKPHVDEVSSLEVVSRDDLGYAATVSRVGLTIGLAAAELELRATLVLFGAEPLATADEPIHDGGEPRSVTALELSDGLLFSGALTDLALGRKAHLSGAAVDGSQLSQLLTLASVTSAGAEHTRLSFAEVLADDLAIDRATLRLNANVVLATHGETIQREVLGSGDGRVSGQHFKLKKADHTWVPEDSVTGRAPTLTVAVDGVSWSRVAALYGQGASARVYTLRTDDDGSVHVGFGDGERGARLPTGQENVVAKYRAGSGSAGEVAARSLALLKKRPLGVRSVLNPEAAFGAEDPETRDAARSAAPAGVRVLSRVVSVRDYEDYALTYPGIGKAVAARLWDGHRELVHLTVGTAAGGEVPAEQIAQLVSSLRAAGDPTLQSIAVQGQETIYFASWIEIAVSADASTVLAAVEVVLLAAFAERAFAEPVLAAELVALAHEVSGVVSVQVRQLLALPSDAAAAATAGAALEAAAAAGSVPAQAAPERLVAARARADASAPGSTLPAQLLLPHPRWGFILTEGVA